MANPLAKEPRTWVRMPAEVCVQFPPLRSFMNEAFVPLYPDQNRYLVLKGGGGSGKSVFASQKLILRILSETPHKFLVVRKVKQDLRDSAYAELLNTIRRWGLEQFFQYSISRNAELYVRCANGNEIIFYGLDDVQRRKSIQGITGMWIEEASEITVEDFRQLDIRLRGETKYYKQIMLSFNPVSITHWLKSEFFDQRKPNATISETTYKDNRFLDAESITVLEGFKHTDEYYYTVYCLGEWGVLGKTVFDAQKVTKRLLQMRKEKFLVGNIVFDVDERGDPIKGTQKFVEDPNGWLVVFEMPKQGYPYVLGGDTAEGGMDWSVGQVIDNTTGRQVARWRGHTDTDLYAKQMYALGWFYNEALIAIETNFDLHPVKELERLRYWNQFKREVVDEITRKTLHKHGWKTTPVTRPPMIDNLVAIVRENVELINDVVTLEEMLTFVRNQDGKPEAQEGKFDDCVLALAIAFKARDQQRMTVIDPSKKLPRSAPRTALDPYTGY